MSRALGVAALLIHQRKRIHELEEKSEKVFTEALALERDRVRLKDQLAKAEAEVERLSNQLFNVEQANRLALREKDAEAERLRAENFILREGEPFDQALEGSE